ncbi:hypothetical protein P7K49_030820 [Saguinus oedipus]|uniref:Uncharacterized protein n=1 Tax=Saguinus oedipus TaxID=9490 RepID=A0ABQ9U403_SAGOE|nr:hypothetical protein P7K49_030820 [Saguinus oedipus]
MLALNALSQSCGFLYEYPLHFSAQLGGSLVTICLLRLHSAAMVLHPTAVGLHPVGGVSLLWQVALAMTGCFCSKCEPQ